ncbi:MAG TPA: hypothetical protein VGP25_18855 [Gemmatimonadaceae bacterium]|jgi:hypothetical protein|nr:hypothetical protein [Gemmatimonadaceae bacterium]
MLGRSRTILSVLALVGSLTACADVTNPSSRVAPSTPSFSGGSSGGGGGGTDSSLVSGGGGGGGGGGGSTVTACGTLSADIQTYNIVVYTTRIGIGFSGALTNCGSKNAAFEVDVVDTTTDPACFVDVPHFIAARNTAPGATTYWSANSTLVNCMNTTHTFKITLIDTKTGQALATTTASAFL